MAPIDFSRVQALCLVFNTNRTLLQVCPYAIPTTCPYMACHWTGYGKVDTNTQVGHCQIFIGVPKDITGPKVFGGCSANQTLLGSLITTPNLWGFFFHICLSLGIWWVKPCTHGRESCHKKNIVFLDGILLKLVEILV